MRLFQFNINLNDASDRRNALVHGIGGALVSLFSYVTAHRYLHLREAYWAPITVSIVLQPAFQMTKKASVDRILGTIVGALIGWGSLAWWHGSPLRYAAAIFCGVSFCWLIRQPVASRTCAVAITVITLIPGTEPAHLIAFYRFTEVTYGALCALVYANVMERFFGRPTSPPSG